jgi:hypothetical protein
MSIYRNVKQKYHPGLTAECQECRAKIAAQDPGFAGRFTKLAQAEKKRKAKSRPILEETKSIPRAFRRGEADTALQQGNTHGCADYYLPAR